jgi:hypothetical protein
VSEIEDPPLRGRTWQDVFNQSLERAEVIRRWNCRGYVLRGAKPASECK